jgi:hypothetical protein
MKKFSSYFSYTNKRARTTEDTPEQMETGIGSESLSALCEATSSSTSSSTVPTASACTVATSERSSSFRCQLAKLLDARAKQKKMFQQV